jgi:hypothetical protein
MKLTILDRENILGYILLKNYQIHEDLSIVLLEGQRQRIRRLIKPYRDNTAIRLENEDSSSVWFPFDTTDCFHWYLGD